MSAASRAVVFVPRSDHYLKLAVCTDRCCCTHSLAVAVCFGSCSCYVPRKSVLLRYIVGYSQMKVPESGICVDSHLRLVWPLGFVELPLESQAVVLPLLLRRKERGD